MDTQGVQGTWKISSNTYKELSSFLTLAFVLSFPGITLQSALGNRAVFAMQKDGHFHLFINILELVGECKDRITITKRYIGVSCRPTVMMTTDGSNRMKHQSLVSCVGGHQTETQLQKNLIYL